MAATHTGTTHNSPRSGHGPKVRRRPFARPVLRPPTGKMAPWFLKGFGGRPAHKRARPLEAVA